jgi:phosphatidylserine/phosphatidylglycerophosphate/cardiolipin synthase-like enzyme
MSLQLKVYDNGDHTCLAWFPSDGKPIANCRGFTIQRTLNGTTTYLHGFVGFSATQTVDPQAPWKMPIQRYMWWDYDVKPGDKVTYTVIPVVGPNQNGLKLDSTNAAQPSSELVISGQSSEHLSAYFNKGIIATQWVSRMLNGQTDKKSILGLVNTPGNSLRNALSGLLRPQILSLLQDAKTSGGHIFAALYELNDSELVPALKALGKKCHLILANGAFKSNTPPNNDENAAVRKELRPIVDLYDRIVPQGHFAHNKFVVFCDSNQNPQAVLTGSTNWTYTGLCTQANNSVIIKDAAVAEDFLAAWNRIKAAGNAYPTPLVTGNSTAETCPVDNASITPWFVKTSQQQDLVAARQRINAAKDGILFLFFEPGAFEQDPNRWTLLQNILERHNSAGSNFDGNLYLCGVANQSIPGLTGPATPKKGQKQPDQVLDPTQADNAVTLYRGATQPPQKLTHDVLIPHNIKTKFYNWVPELLGAGLVNIHSKVIVIDPFGEKPVVMSGSHNLGYKASSANDDNLVIIEGNASLAAAYAINIIAIFQSYRWNAYVTANARDPKVWHGLVDNDTWQEGYLQGDELRELEFWVGSGTTASAAGKTIATPKAPNAVPEPRKATPKVPPAAHKLPKAVHKVRSSRVPIAAKKRRRDRKKPQHSR